MRCRGGRRVECLYYFLPKVARAAVFVDGCFWHGCPKHANHSRRLRKSSMPANPPTPYDRRRRAGNPSTRLRTGRAFSKRKLTANPPSPQLLRTSKARDRFVNRALRKPSRTRRAADLPVAQQGWRVLRIWERALAKRPERCVRRIRKMLIPSSGRYRR